MHGILRCLCFWILGCIAYSAPLPYKNLVFSLSGGPGWASPFQASVLSTPVDPYQQVQLSYPNTQTMGIGEFFISSENPFYHDIQVQFGGAVSGAGAASSAVSRYLNDYNSYNKYQLTQYRVALRGKLFSDAFYFKPYVTSSVGAGFTSIAPQENLNSYYQISYVDNTAYSFNYTFGAGIQHNLNKQWAFSIGYEYYNWGKADINLVSSLDKNTYNLQLPIMHTLLISLSYRIAP